MRVKSETHNLEIRTQVPQNRSQDTNSGILRSFSTLLRNFQVFNLVSVSVNVLTDREDERMPEKPRKNETQPPDYYRDIFGESYHRVNKKALIHESESQIVASTEKGEKIPIIFKLLNSDRHDLFTASTTTSYREIISKISELITSSPNYQRKEENNASKVEIEEINVKWECEDRRDWPEKTRLTKENCEAVLLVMERGRVGIFEIGLDGRGKDGLDEE